MEHIWTLHNISEIAASSMQVQYIPKLNTDFGKSCFKYNGAVVWNNLPYAVKVADSLSSFQRTINRANT
jgi:hypothetical protein